MKITYNGEEMDCKEGSWKCAVAGVWVLLLVLAIISAFYLVMAGLFSLLWDFLWGCFCFFLLFVVVLLAIGVIGSIGIWVWKTIKHLILGVAVKVIEKTESKKETE